MRNGFSDITKLYIAKQDILIEAEHRFRREWAEILTEVRRRLSRGGWAFRTDIEPPHEELKIRRANWPDGVCGVHYEVRAQERFRREGVADIGLHIEQDVPEYEQVSRRLRRLIRPYSSHITELLAECAPSLPETPPQKVLIGQLPLAEITPEVICMALEKMVQTESFVDEALVLAGKKTLWRTDFDKDLDDIWINWFGIEGGQTFTRGVGRFGSVAMKVDGTQPNGRAKYKEQGNYSVLLHPTHEITNGMDVYICAVVKTTKGGTIQFKADAHRGKTPEGHDAVPVLAFAMSHPIEPSERWQCIFLQAKVPTTNKIDYDYAKEGAWVVMNIVTEDREFLIDSVEIGRCG